MKVSDRRTADEILNLKYPKSRPPRVVQEDLPPGGVEAVERVATASAAAGARGEWRKVLAARMMCGYLADKLAAAPPPDDPLARYFVPKLRELEAGGAPLWSEESAPTKGRRTEGSSSAEAPAKMVPLDELPPAAAQVQREYRRRGKREAAIVHREYLERDPETDRVRLAAEDVIGEDCVSTPPVRIKK